jgi:hypothetical protein
MATTTGQVFLHLRYFQIGYRDGVMAELEHTFLVHEIETWLSKKKFKLRGMIS